MNYKALIKNITNGKWLMSETNGIIKETKNQENALVLYDSEDAESLIEFLNDSFADCYTLIEYPCFAVTFSVSGTIFIAGENEEEVRERAQNLSDSEILDNCRIALNGDAYCVGLIEECED